jgi:ATP-dependent DNA ligase
VQARAMASRRQDDSGSCTPLEGNADVARVRTRHGLDWADRFPVIAASATKLPCQNAIIDGEVVVLDAKRRPDFAAPARSMRKPAGASR